MTPTLEGAVKSDKGVSVNGMLMQPVIEKCEGCDRVKEFETEKFCSSYPAPAAKWRLGVCNFATHVKATVDTQGKVKINPLKASKRAARGR